MSTALEQGTGTAPRGTLFALVSHTARMQLRSVIIWGAALGLYSAAMVASFTAIEGSAEQLNQLMEAYPKGMLEAFGVTDLGDPPLPALAVLRPRAAGPLVLPHTRARQRHSRRRRARDHRRPARQPLPRWQLVRAASSPPPSRCSGSAPSSASSPGSRPRSWTLNSLREITDGVLNLWPITVAFGSLALLCSSLFHRRALAISIPAFLLFGMYLIDAIGRASEDLEDGAPPPPSIITVPP